MLKILNFRSVALLCAFLYALAFVGETRAQEMPPAWTIGTHYVPNDRVSYNNAVYKCLQTHTAIVSWEPPNAPALWQIDGGTTNNPTNGAIFFDDFETNANWTINPNNSDTATSGIWERGVPQASRYKGLKQTDAARSGTNVLVTGRVAYNDVNGLTSIRSPNINLPAGASNLTLSFWYTFAHDSRSNNQDYFAVKIIGAATQTVFQIAARAQNRNAKWQKQTINLDQFAGQTIRIQFEAADAATNSIVEVAVDDVEIKTSAVAGQPFPAKVFAPYVDVLLYPPFPLAQTAASVGVKYYTLAFITNGASQCQASWGGAIAMSENYLLSDINQLRQMGGNVIVSFGGANGIELANSCQTVESLAAQYRHVIERYNLTHLDFDIEGGAVENQAANDRRSKAIRLLQIEAAAENRVLNISYTLQVSPGGLVQSGINLLQNAVANGADVSTVNIMTMDYGGGANPNQMAQHAISAANGTFAQIRPIFSTRTEAEVRRMIGITPMIGLNDVVPETFTLADAQTVLNYANANNIGRIAMWSMTRDKQCAGAPQISYDCSGITQTPFAFSNIFKQFTQ